MQPNRPTPGQPEYRSRAVATAAAAGAVAAAASGDLPDLSGAIDQATEQRTTAMQAAEAILGKATAEKRDLTEDEAKDVAKHQATAEQAQGRLSILQRQSELRGVSIRVVENRTAGAGDPANNRATATLPTADADERQRQRDEIELRAFDGWLRNGYADLSPEDKDVLAEMRANLPREAQAQVRALGVDGTGAAGAYTVPQAFYRRITAALKQYGGMLGDGPTEVNTGDGAPMPIPTVDDTGNTGAIIAESGAHDTSVTDPAFGQKNLGAYMYSSKVVRASFQMLQDAFFDVEGWLAEQLSMRLYRILNAHLTTGTGSGQPEGVVTGSVLGVTAAGATAVTYDETIELLHSVDPMYRNRPGFAYMFNDSTLLALRKLKDSNGRPLWSPSFQGVAPTINGTRYIINQDMPSMTTGLKSILCGDFSYYLRRAVRNLTIIRLGERYAELGQVGIVALGRWDGVLADPAGGAQSPIKHLIQA